MTEIPVSYPGYEQWSFTSGAVLAHHSVFEAVKSALAESGSLYAWARGRPNRDVFRGRGEVYGVTIGSSRAVVRHARRGGVLAPLLGDRFFGPPFFMQPRFVRELDIADRLNRAEVPTPRVLAGVLYPSLLVHRADVATERVDGTDLYSLFFAPDAPQGERRRQIFEAVGTLVRRLHDASFVHPDLQLRNVLIDGSNGAWLLDVDTCRRIRVRDEAARRANIARFERSWDKWNALSGRHLMDDDLAAFHATYHQRPA